MTSVAAVNEVWEGEPEKEGAREKQKIPQNTSVIGTNATVALCVNTRADVRMYAQKTSLLITQLFALTPTRFGETV